MTRPNDGVTGTTTVNYAALEAARVKLNGLSDEFRNIAPDFMTQAADGHQHIKDPGQIYLDKNTTGGKKAWDDFKAYCDEAGVAWLLKHDLYDGFALGAKEPR